MSRMPTRQGSFRLFQVAGITVYLHWSWFIFGWIRYKLWGEGYNSFAWYALEYSALFFIVLLHEFGHALACRQVGGQANTIVLWPLGGVAYVAPPQRPGAMLWSLAAGPLVNVVLCPLLLLLLLFSDHAGWPDDMPNVYFFIRNVFYINLGLLIFNLLPIYPLDGGQILRSLLWFPFGRATSLLIASCLGFVGVAVIGIVALWLQSGWIGIMAAFIALNCWQGFRQARILSRLDNAPRRPGFACPVCKAAPPSGDFWGCSQCRKPFDIFATVGVCPNCHAAYAVTNCIECGSSRPIAEWILNVPQPTPAQPPPPPAPPA
jgi:Zn-dependent protease